MHFAFASFRRPAAAILNGRAPRLGLPGVGAPLQELVVRWAYPVRFTRELFAPANQTLREVLCYREARRHRVLAVIDAGVPGAAAALDAWAALHADAVELVAPPLVHPGGEAIKNDPDAPRRLQALLAKWRIDRRAFVLAVGGGALLDLVGFVAATVHRGVRLVRVPSTTLAQADAGVGVKNGVNAFGQKNFLGAFAPPFAVIVDFALLRSLGPRERRAGLAEAVKVALIKDASFFAWLAAHARALDAGVPAPLEQAVQTAAALHLRHIRASGDPFERGTARPLDFGHWAAHKLEMLSGGALLHGEAVAIGVALDVRYSVLSGRCRKDDCEAACDALERMGFRLWHEALALCDAAGRRRVLDGIAEFQAHLGGELAVTLLERIGRGVEVHALDEGLLEGAIAWLEARDHARDAARACG